MVRPTSGFNWWSADTISTGRLRTATPASLTASSAAMTEPRPTVSAMTPDMSVRTPIFSGSPRARPLHTNKLTTAAARAAMDVILLLLVVPLIHYPHGSWKPVQTHIREGLWPVHAGQQLSAECTR